ADEIAGRSGGVFGPSRHRDLRLVKGSYTALRGPREGKTEQAGGEGKRTPSRSAGKMLSLKKYFTEGLIQFTILLSLIGVRVDVDTYLNSQLPPLREIILGQSSAYTQTQFHNLRNTLDGYGIHPKSVDLDYYFTARRLLNQVRALDRFQVPTTEVNAWLVHRDPEGSVSGGQPGAGIALENGSGLQDGSNPDSGVRESGAEQGFGEELEDLGAVAAPANGDLTKE
ncbi:PREDICTED: nuclear factor erythroid 2-related factor 1, partial [Chlamydotis macqueenii]|uniref:nuclear factor erythroid 2-related factor 1 n=1 Tax=Chlamydotis macqueenii TaxID=187382 RepID=UPI000529D9F4